MKNISLLWTDNSYQLGTHSVWWKWFGRVTIKSHERNTNNCLFAFPLQVSLWLEGPSVWSVCDVPRLCVRKLQRTLAVCVWCQLGRTAVWQRSDMWPVICLMFIMYQHGNTVICWKLTVETRWHDNAKIQGASPDADRINKHFVKLVSSFSWMYWMLTNMEFFYCNLNNNCFYDQHKRC